MDGSCSRKSAASKSIPTVRCRASRRPALSSAGPTAGHPRGDACVVCEVAPCPLPETRENVGIDLGIEHFATLSTGEQLANPKCYRRVERKLKTAHELVERF